MFCFVITDGTENQSALPFRKTGFFNKLRIVLNTRSARPGHLSVTLQECCIFLIFTSNSCIIELYHCLPPSPSNFFKKRLEVDKIIENSLFIAFIVLLFLFLKGIVQTYFEKLSIITEKFS